MQPRDPDGTATGLYAQADLPPGTVLCSRFRIERLLGLGGMGMVYCATDTSLDCPVALKILRPELMHRADAIERFRQELLLARQVSNPHVVRIHDLAQDGNLWLLTMDFVEGESLDRKLDREGRFEVDDALRIARQLADGLAAAHARGVVHRDLKPANVLLDAEGNAYISDFGVARSLAAGGMTRTGSVVGTPDYVSPEQARGDDVDARSDLYALGLILYEMLAGKLPFAGGTVTEVLAQRMTRTPPPLDKERTDLPPWVVRLVDRLLRPQPAHRLQNAGEVVRAIDTRSVPWDRHTSRKNAITIVAVLALVAGIAGGAWWWTKREVAAPPAIAVTPPLERVLVLPIAHDAEIPDARALAWDAHLRDAFAATPGLAIVDGDRTAQALRQLDAVRAGRYDIATLHRTAAATRILQPVMRKSTEGWHVDATLHAVDGTQSTLNGTVAKTPADALRTWVAAPPFVQSLRVQAAPVLALPASDTALDALGASLAAKRDGHLADAFTGIQEATKASPDDAALWLAQADAALAIGEQDAAYDATERGLRAPALRAANPSTTDRRLRARLIAAQSLLDGEAPAAAAQWRALLSRAHDDTEAELNMARALGAGGDFNAAIKTLQTLTARDPNDPRAWFELGKFSILRGEARRAVDDHLVRALVLFKRGRDLYGEAETVNALGVGYGRLGQTADATEQYRKAVELRRKLGNRRGVATSLRNLANVLSLTGRYDEAQRSLEEARKLNAALDDRAGQAAVDNELGLLAEERGDTRAALAAFRRALQGWRQAEDAHGTADALNNIGFAHFQLGAYDDAQTNWQQAANVFDTLGEDTGRIRTQQNLGLLATARGRWKQARRLLDTSLSRAEQLQMPEEAAVSRRNLAELELAQGHVAAAISQAQTAQALFNAREDHRGESDAGLLHVRALLAADALPAARRELAKLGAALRDASTEQHALAQLATAGIATRDRKDAQAALALRTAKTLAARSGVRQLQLQVLLEQTNADAEADAQTRTLGNASLRLQWLEQAMRAELANGDRAKAEAHYREALAWLRNGDALRAEQLHALGAQATRDPADAAVARDRANAARAAFHDALPPALRPKDQDVARQ